MKKHGFLKRYDVDEDFAENGIWVEFGDGVKVKIRSANSTIAGQILEDLYAPYRALARTKKMPADLDVDLMQQWAGLALIVDWEKMPHFETEKVIPYSNEAAVAQCRGMPEFTIDVINISKERATFAPVEAGELAGNSPKPSRGKPTTESE